MMDGKQYLRLTREAGKLFDQYEGYLKYLYNTPWKQLRNQENESLAILALSLKCDVRNRMIQQFESETRNVYFFWQAVEQELPLISFAYIDWTVQMPDVIEIFARNSEEDSSKDDSLHLLETYNEPRSPRRKEERMVLSVRVKKAHEQNTRQLKGWLEQYVRLVQSLYNSYEKQ